jgi:hypothetical protein
MLVARPVFEMIRNHSVVHGPMVFYDMDNCCCQRQKYNKNN